MLGARTWLVAVAVGVVLLASGCASSAQPPDTSRAAWLEEDGIQVAYPDHWREFTFRPYEWNGFDSRMNQIVPDGLSRQTVAPRPDNGEWISLMVAHGTPSDYGVNQESFAESVLGYLGDVGYIAKSDMKATTVGDYPAFVARFDAPIVRPGEHSPEGPTSAQARIAIIFSDSATYLLMIQHETESTLDAWDLAMSASHRSDTSAPTGS